MDGWMDGWVGGDSQALCFALLLRRILAVDTVVVGFVGEWRGIARRIVT